MMQRRTFLKLAATAAAIASGAMRMLSPLQALARTPALRVRKVLCLGLDGMDPDLLQRFMAEGILPNFKRLVADGDFRVCGTSIPPQSPVAWSNFITCQNPGGHGTFDFIHRKSDTLLPMLSLAETQPPSRFLHLGKWKLPRSGGQVELLRQGKAFWEYLAAADLDVTVFKMPATSISFEVVVDPVHPVVKIQVGDTELILQEGEWSDWVTLHFGLIPHLKEVTGICRFYLMEVRPSFRLYVSPVQIDLSNPAMPICTPPDYARELVDRVGPFYTQGLPDDTKALDEGIFQDGDYIKQAELVLNERLRQYRYELTRFRDLERSFLFFYFKSLDQNCHMFWRNMNLDSPLHADSSGRHGDRIRNLYVAMDRVLGEALAILDRLLDELVTRLEAVVEPQTGTQPVKYAYRADQIYTGPFAHTALDLILGYRRGYRGSNESALGEIAPVQFGDNLKKWSGDHCMAADEVPGMLVCSRKVKKAEVSLLDMAPTFLCLFGLDPAPDIIGHDIFA